MSAMKAPRKKSTIRNSEESLPERPPLGGLRLEKFEMYNWGVFDGVVHSVVPNGQTTLLVGENGSGKSTVVDALLTLLVRPQGRSYNLAAGAARNERDERSYIRGAHDRTTGDHGQPQVQYLRPGNSHYTVLLAVFRNYQSNASITLCQVLYLNPDNSVERVYAFSESARSIVHDLGDLSSGSTLAKQLKERGFETTTSYNQYFGWLQKKSGLRSKSMDIFNQTVAVKDVQRLDGFIRQHMLEKQAWNERVTKLLTHFAELSEAHRLLVRVRSQAQFLAPIVAAGDVYRKHYKEVEVARKRIESLPLYFAEQSSALLQPICAKLKQQIKHHQSEVKRIDGLLDGLRRDIARFELNLEGAAGDRLRQLPTAIEQAEILMRAKGDARIKYETLLSSCGIRRKVTSPEQFHRVTEELETRRQSLLAERERWRERSHGLQYQMGALEKELQAAKLEMKSLASHQSNLPESLTTLRDRLCETLRLPPSELPFTAELVDIHPAERRWQSSIELVLSSFARSLLVPTEYYDRVSRYVEENRLVDPKGRGQRLTYIRVTRIDIKTKPRAEKGTLLSKLRFRPHPQMEWVKAEIANRFPFLACETIESFQASDGPAMTAHRHIKRNSSQHQKDDRSEQNDGSAFVLGWDSQEKQKSLLQWIHANESVFEKARREVQSAFLQIDSATQSLKELEQIAAYQTFDEIDSERHEFVSAQLKLELRQLESSNDVVTDLTKKLAAMRSEAIGHQEDRDVHISNGTRLEGELKHGSKMLDSALHQIEHARSKGSWDRYAADRTSTANSVAIPLTLENIGTLPSATLMEHRNQVESLSEKLSPLSRDVTSAMSKYLRAFPEENIDLDPDVACLDDFQSLYEKISSDDLPKHEERFKNRLNEKVLHEVGLLHSSLENDREEIREKISQLNSSLRLLQWKPGTFMKLEATDVADREIQDFRKDLAACLSGSSDGQLEINETTYVKIERLIGKLRDPSNERWREKVADVRNWFHFAAREIVAESGESRSYYEGGSGQSGGEKGKLAFLVLVAAIAYQYDLKHDDENHNRFQFVMVDEMFSRSDDAHAEFALDLFQRFGLQLLIVAPLDSKIRVTEPYVGVYVHVVKDKTTHRSELITVTSDPVRDPSQPRTTLDSK
jgi:uncharacterized protein YPO0396